MELFPPQEWDAYKSGLKPPSLFDEQNTTDGMTRWKAAVVNADLPENADRAIQDLKRTLNRVEDTYESLTKIAAGMRDGARAFSATTQSMANAVSEWKGVRDGVAAAAPAVVAALPLLLLRHCY